MRRHEIELSDSEGVDLLSSKIVGSVKGSIETYDYIFLKGLVKTFPILFFSFLANSLLGTAMVITNVKIKFSLVYKKIKRILTVSHKTLFNLNDYFILRLYHFCTIALKYPFINDDDGR